MRRLKQRRLKQRSWLRPPLGGPLQLEEWKIGLQAAKQLRQAFPAFFAEHVAPRQVSLDSLLGAGAALVTLVGAIVVFSDYAYDLYCELMGSSHTDALERLDHPPAFLSSGEDMWDSLTNFLAHPELMVYGLDLYSEDQEVFPALAVALTTITGHEFFDRDDLASVLGVEGEDHHLWPYFEAVACMLPRVQCTQDRFDTLCAALRGTTCYGADLGDILAYSHQRTDNLFANVGYFEADDARGNGAHVVEWWDNDIDFAEIARLQAEARALSASYGRLEERVVTNPNILVDEIADAIAQAAKAMGLLVVWPGDDEEDNTNDDTSQDEGEEERAPTEAEEDAALAPA